MLLISILIEQKQTGKWTSTANNTPKSWIDGKKALRKKTAAQAEPTVLSYMEPMEDTKRKRRTEQQKFSMDAFKMH